MNYQHLAAEEYIKKTICFGSSTKFSGSQSLNVAYGIDKNFLFGCGISIASILLHNKSTGFIFHIFVDVVTEDELNKFSRLASDNNTCIHIHIVNCDRLGKFPTTKNWSIATYFRFIIGDYFIGKEERVLFMDADIMCKGSISELATLPLEGNVAAVVPEKDASWWSKRAKGLDCPELKSGYFNAGFLLINVSEWAKEYVSAKALAMLADKNIVSKLSYLDQDLLNMILVGEVIFIDGKYNTQFSINYELKPDFNNPIDDDTVLIHYIGPTKPWHYWACYDSAGSFMKAKIASPWKDSPLLKPSNSNYARYCAKHNFKQGKPFAGLMSYIYYFYLRIF